MNLEHIRLTRSLGGKPMGAVISVSPGVAEHLIRSGDAVPIAK